MIPVPDLRALVATAVLEDLPALAGRLAEAQALLELRLRQSERPASVSQVGRHVSVAEAAKLLGCSKELLYHNELPFVRRLRGRVVVDLAAAEVYMVAGHGRR